MSQFSIDSFKANLINGGSRPNLYLVSGTFPGSSGGAFVNAAAAAAGALFGQAAAGLVTSGAAFAGIGSPSNQVGFLCRAASLPSSNITITQIPFRGREYKIPGDRVFDNWSIRIYNDASFGLRNAFERWQNLINSGQSNLGPNSAQAFEQEWRVSQLGRDGQILKTYKFVGCWPVRIGDIALSFDASSQIEEFDVELAYQYFISDGITT